jgi:adenosylcobinamide-GDP ribazoletransferase
MGGWGFWPVGWLGERCGIAPPGLPRKRRHSAIRTACLWPAQRAGRPRSSTGIILALDIAFSDMDARRGPFDEFLLAAGVLTRFPIATDAAEPGAIAAAGWAFPLVGGGIGALCAAVFFAAGLFGLPVGPAALLAVAAGLAATGALHEDGLADTADGFGGGRNRDQKLAIMRDSAHGTYGVVALVLSVGLRVTAVAAIRDPVFVGLTLIAAHAASRAVLPAAMRLLPPARADGLGAAAGRPSRGVALLAALIGAAIALATLGPLTGVLTLLLAGGAVTLAGMLARRQIGGYTGDVLGFFQQIGEIVMLLVAAAAR